MRRVALVVLLLSAALSFLFWKYSDALKELEFKRGKKETVIKYWGFYEEGVVKPVIDAYNESHPGIKVLYTKQSLTNYRTRVQTQIRASQGPDIFPLHSSWVSMFFDDLATAPEATFPLSGYRKIFYPVALDSLVINNKIYAIPTEIDGLVMFVNNDLLQTKGAKIPTTWQELVEVSKQLVEKDETGKIKVAAAGMGATENIEFWPEIVGLLFLQQPGADLEFPATAAGGEVLNFYSAFVTDPQKKSWDTTLPPDLEMFKGGKLGFFFAPASYAQKIKEANPSLNFTAAVVPQLSNKKVSWGAFWANGVAINSSAKGEAWDFLQYLSSPEVLRKIYQKQVDKGLPVAVYPRVDMASELSNEPIMSIIATQGNILKGWYLNSKTADVGINEEMISYYKKALDNLLQGGESNAALQEITLGVKETLSKYAKISPTGFAK